MRTVLVVIAVVAVATVLSEIVGVGILWYRGQLTGQTLSDIRLLLSGDPLYSADQGKQETPEQPSSEDYRRRRTMRVLELNTREQELELLKAMVTDNRQSLMDGRRAFERQKQQFEERLRSLEQESGSEAAEQARGILKTLQPADAAEHLMELTLEQNVLLLKGMSERSVARILEQMLQGDDEQKKRGSEIFEAISQGDPARSVMEETLNQLSGQPAAAGQ